MSDNQHLWEIDHPYYCSEGSYWVPGTRWHEVHADYSSWADFMDEWGGNDSDLNLLFRWDWQRSDPSDYQDDEDVPGDQLHLFYMMQRKARNMSVYVVVTEADEPAVREWLTTKADHMRKLWEPLLVTT